MNRFIRFVCCTRSNERFENESPHLYCTVDYQKHAKRKAITYRDHERILKILNYGDVVKISNHMYQLLAKHISEKHSCVGLLMEHNIFIPSLIISLQKLEHAFIFLDVVETPNFKLTDKLNMKWIISLDEFPKEFYELYELKAAMILLSENKLHLWKLKRKIDSKTNFENICYIIQTSGTTGQKKLVSVENECIFSNISSLQNIFNMTCRDRIYFGTALTFDPSMVELFLALTIGANLLIVSRKMHINPTYLFKALFTTNLGVTILQMPPSLLLRWNVKDLEYILDRLYLKVLAVGGEKFPESILKLKRSKYVRLFNLYGITEVSCWASAFEIKHGVNEIFLGTPLDDTLLEVRDDNKCCIKEGVGELFIGSSHRICNINNKIKKKPVFRATGDLVEIQGDNITYLGRKNGIIKRFGCKVDLNQIEKLVLSTIELENRCVWIEDQSKLLLFMLTKDFDNVTKDKVLDKISIKLLHSLPKECYPDYLDILLTFPLTFNGKIDNAALKKIYLVNTGNTDDKPYRIFTKLWCKYFGLNSTHNLRRYQDCSFFEMGGNSFLVNQFLSELKIRLNCDVPRKLVSLIFEKNFLTCRNFMLKKSKLLTKRSLANTVKNNLSENAKTECKKNKLCLETSWTYDLKACVDTSAVIFDHNCHPRIAIGCFSQIFAILDTQTGNEICKTVLPAAIKEAPCISPKNDKAYVSCLDGNMYCIDIETCSITWTYSTKDLVKNTSCYCLENKRIVFGSYDKHIYCLDAETGELVWQTNLNECIRSSAVYDKNIYIAGLNGTCFCIKEEDGEILWKYSADNPIFGSPCLYNSDLVIWPVVDGSIHGVSTSKGEMVCIYKGLGMIYSSIVGYKGCLIFGCFNHKVYCLEVKENSFICKYRVVLDSQVFSTPLVVENNNDTLIVAATTKGTIYVICFNTGDILCSVSLPGEIFSSPCSYNENIYIGCRDNNLHCLKIINS